MSDLPIVCSLDSAGLGRRLETLRAALFARAEELIAHDNGIRLRFEPGGNMLETIAGVIDAERLCCRFLRFQLTVDPDEGPIWLEMSGPPGTSEFLASWTES